MPRLRCTVTTKTQDTGGFLLDLHGTMMNNRSTLLLVTLAVVLGVVVYLAGPTVDSIPPPASAMTSNASLHVLRGREGGAVDFTGGGKLRRVQQQGQPTNSTEKISDEHLAKLVLSITCGLVYGGPVLMLLGTCICCACVPRLLSRKLALIDRTCPEMVSEKLFLST